MLKKWLMFLVLCRALMGKLLKIFMLLKKEKEV
jgi:hypothetical protein